MTGRERWRVIKAQAAENSLRQVYVEHGAITVALWDASGYKPCAQALRMRYGSWRKAWAFIGVDLDAERHEQRRQAALQRIREISATYGRIETKRWDELGLLPVAGQLRRLFGSYHAAWHLALGTPAGRSRLYAQVTPQLLENPNLSPLQGYILRQILATNRNLSQIAADLGITREWARQLVHRAIDGHAARQPGRPKKEQVNACV